MKFRDRSLSGRGTSVCQDWCSCLSETKAAFFESCTENHKASYYMLGVTLNEAAAKCRAGQIVSCLQSVALAPALCARWTDSISALLRSLAGHAKHHGTLPSVAPLQASNFNSLQAQSSARLNALLSHVLLTQRAQFLRKSLVLLELAEDLGDDFSSEIAQASKNVDCQEGEVWELMELLGSLHHDLNTCWEEALVLLKSFLVALPENQFAIFETTYGGQVGALATLRRKLSDRQTLRNRRFVYIGEQ